MNGGTFFRSVRKARWWWITSAILCISIFRAGTIFDYSLFAIDEQLVVVRAMGFLGGDLNPRWFIYHSFPLYILGAVYFLQYLFASIVGTVSSKAEFVSLLFDHHAQFYITARLLCSIVYTSGAAILAWILYRHAGSRLWAVVFFIAVNALPDAVLASNWVKVDSFVLFFLSAGVYFSCFAPKNFRSFLLAVACCSAAFASKAPAAVFSVALFIQLIVDIRNGHYPLRYLVYFAILYPVMIFLFMPYAFLDFESYRYTLARLSSRVGGDFVHVGKEQLTGPLERVMAMVAYTRTQVGIGGIAGALAFVWYAIRLDRRWLIPVFFVALYAGAFITSVNIDWYWLRPVYPFLLFFTVAFIARANLDRRMFARMGSRRVKYVLAAVVLVYFGVVAFQSRVGHLRALRSEGEDTRVIAGKWIEANLDPESTIKYDGPITTYQPRLLAGDPRLAEEIHLGMPIDRRGPAILQEASGLFYARALNERRPVHVEVYEPEYSAAGFEPPSMFSVGDYVVTTSDFTSRFSNQATREDLPILAEEAARYYEYLSRQKLVKEFKGNGPVIRIYRIVETESFPRSLLDDG